MLTNSFLAAVILFAPPGPRGAPEGISSQALAGPRVDAHAPASLVQRDFNGALVKLELFPAHAAVRFLQLDAQARAKVESILSERAALLDSAVRDHFELLIELFSAGQGGDAAEAIRIAVAFTQRLRPLIDRGALEAELSRVLPHDQAQRLHALVREYHDALMSEMPMNEKGKPKSRFEVIAGETLRLWGEQVRLSFERQIVGGDLFFERIIRQLQLRPDQENRVRDRIALYVEETKLNPTKAQEQRFALEIMAWLDPAQQKALIRLFQQAEGKYKVRPKAVEGSAGRTENPGGDSSSMKAPPGQ